MNASHEPLNSFLQAHDARLLWEKRVSKLFTVSGWSINGRAFIVTKYDDGGWDIFTAPDSIKVAETIEDAEKRLGLK